VPRQSMQLSIGGRAVTFVYDPAVRPAGDLAAGPG
jgi:hypothetical protein